jgi:hypothetical protein
VQLAEQVMLYLQQAIPMSIGQILIGDPRAVAFETPEQALHSPQAADAASNLDLDPAID